MANRRSKRLQGSSQETARGEVNSNDSWASKRTRYEPEEVEAGSFALSMQKPKEAATGLSEQEKIDFKRYREALLLSRNESHAKTLEEVSRGNKINFLKKIFSLEFFPEEQKVDLEECFYKFFMFFSDRNFAEESYAREVLNWLFEKGVEEIIKSKDQVRMIHWLAASNNLEGVKWAFGKYHDNNLREVFAIHDEYGEDLFDYTVKGIVMAENSSLSWQEEIVALVLTKFGEAISNLEEMQREQKMNGEKRKLLDLLEAETCLTENLREQLTI